MKLSLKILDEILFYDKDEGCLYWKIRPLGYFKSSKDWKRWNTKYAGASAGTVQSNGYKYLTIFGRPYRYHRIVWWLSKGIKPKLELDHIDHDKLNNRIDNLREVPRGDNNRNHPKSKRKYPKGIKATKFNKFEVYITHDKRYHYLGHFEDLAEAISVRKQAEIEYGFHENHGK